jgi:hypothetical protein
MSRDADRTFAQIDGTVRLDFGAEDVASLDVAKPPAHQDGPESREAWHSAFKFAPPAYPVADRRDRGCADPAA